MQENSHYPKPVGKPLRLELYSTSPKEHVSELIVLGERMFSVSVDKFCVVGKKSKMDNVSLMQNTTRIPLLKYRYLGSFPSDYVQILPSETFAIKNTQPSNMQVEQSIMIANS